MFKSAILVLFAAALAARADITVSTPGDAAQCSKFSFNVGGSTTGARFAYIMKSAEPCGDPVSEEIAVDDAGNFSWTATSAGRYVAVVDNNDGTVEGWSASFNVQDAGLSNCADAANATPSTTATASQGSTGSSGNSGNRSGNSAPVNAAQTTGLSTGGASRSTVGGVTALTLVGAVAAILSI